MSRFRSNNQAPFAIAALARGSADDLGHETCHRAHRFPGSRGRLHAQSLRPAELWHWTGDKDLVRPFVEPALKALRWLDEYGDGDRDGFHEYQTRSEQGVRNQGWKDSEDAIVHADGSQAPVPIATCE